MLNIKEAKPTWLFESLAQAAGKNSLRKAKTWPVEITCRNSSRTVWLKSTIYDNDEVLR